MNPGGRDCSEPRSCHCTPAYMTERDYVSKQNKTKTWGGLGDLPNLQLMSEVRMVCGLLTNAALREKAQIYVIRNQKEYEHNDSIPGSGEKIP